MSISEGTTLLHNPRCSKSRLALQMLEESGVAFQVREYLVEPLSRSELEVLQELLEVLQTLLCPEHLEQVI